MVRLYQCPIKYRLEAPCTKQGTPAPYKTSRRTWGQGGQVRGGLNPQCPFFPAPTFRSSWPDNFLSVFFTEAHTYTEPECRSQFGFEIMFPWHCWSMGGQFTLAMISFLGRDLPGSGHHQMMKTMMRLMAMMMTLLTLQANGQHQSGARSSWANSMKPDPYSALSFLTTSTDLIVFYAGLSRCNCLQIIYKFQLVGCWFRSNLVWAAILSSLDKGCIEIHLRP